ncbi:MAG: hypothetical protein V7731_06300 [Amphritea sp.]
MMSEFWHQRRASGRIGFHQRDVNDHLLECWFKVSSIVEGQVLVPLCGKSERDIGRTEVVYILRGKF